MDEETRLAGFTAGAEVKGVILSPTADKFATLSGTDGVKM
jgi:hypothetical protein